MVDEEAKKKKKRKKRKWNNKRILKTPHFTITVLSTEGRKAG